MVGQEGEAATMIRLLDHTSIMLEDMVILDMALREVSLAQRSVHTLSCSLFLLSYLNISPFRVLNLVRNGGPLVLTLPLTC